MQTLLEKQGIESRKNNVNNNDYLKDDSEYQEKHKNAISDGDKRGKGTNSGGYIHYKPWEKESSSVAYNIAIESNNVGGEYDINARKSLETYSLYHEGNKYDVNHENAISDEGKQGKGTLNGGHTHTIPNPDKPKSIDYSSFNTGNGGNLFDIEGREGRGGRNFLKTISLYNEDTPYGAHMIDTSANKADGQIIM